MDFTSFCSIAPPTVKKVKLELFNSFDDETMSTIIETQIPFLSLRQKYGIHTQGSEFPLPKKYSQLLDFLSSIEMNYIKNLCQIQFTIENNMAEIVQVSQLLHLEPTLYRIKVLKSGIVIQHPFHKKNDIKKDLPILIQERILHIKQKLQQIVQEQHKRFLINTNCEDFEEFSEQFKIYHNDFDFNQIYDITPIKLKRNVFSKELIQFYKESLNYIIEQYDKRGVSFMFQEHLITILSINFNKIKSEIENLIKNLIKLLPDSIQIIKNHINQSRWMIQIDKNIGNSDILNKFLYI